MSDRPENPMAARRHVPLRRLRAPAPDDDQLRWIFAAAAQAPDHGVLLPWRFIVITDARRAALAQAFAEACVQRDPQADAAARERAAEKAYHAPCLVVAVLVDDPATPSVPSAEKLVSLGCALQNMLLAARGLGYDSGLASGAAMDAPALRRLLRLAAHEQAVCFVGFGTAEAPRAARARPSPERFVSVL